MIPPRGRRRALAGLLVLASGCLTRVHAAPIDFDVPAGPATQSIGRFAQQAGITLIFPYELAEGRTTRAVRGSLEVDDALGRLLRGSGLAFRRRDGQIVIEPQRRAAAATERPRTPLETSIAAADGDVPAEVVVTGSRLEPTGMSSLTPVTVLTEGDLRLFGPASLVDALVQLPQFLNNDTPRTQSFGTSGASGASHLNLRGIGSIRTLTLLDGRRLVPSTRFGTVDLALLPRSLVNRVEVVTGGASAAYGSDAVSGVANLLLDSRYEGLKVVAQAGLTELGDGANESFELTWGAPVGERSHLVVAAEGLRADGIRGYGSRSWFRSRAAIANPDPAGPREITVDDVHAAGYTAGGLITGGPLAGLQFLPGGITAPFARGAYRTAATQAGGDGIDPAATLVWILPNQTRSSGFLKLTSDLSPRTSTFVQVLAGQSRNEFGKDWPSLWGPWEATIHADNAFLPANVRDAMAANGLESFRFGRIAAEDLGRGMVENRSDLLSTTLGASWQVDDTWRLEGYYQYGRNHNTVSYRNAARIDRLYRALDSVVDAGRIVCRSTLTFPDDGCVPLNLFGEGAPSPEAAAYVTEGSTSLVQHIEQHVAEIAAQGTPLVLPAGPVRVAAGVNWRHESSNTFPRRRPASLAAATVNPAEVDGYRGLPEAYLTSQVLFERTVEARVAGGYSVREAFAETALPLLASPAAGDLSAHVALRYASYEGSGTIAAWKFGLDWRASDSLRLRATRSRDVRAGNLAERFDVSSSGVTIRDRLRAGEPSYAIVAVRVSDPAIEPEKGDTRTIGLVYEPRWAPRLALSADYYDIRIRGTITTLGAQVIVDQCAEGNVALCALIARSPDGMINRISNPLLNIDQSRSRGLDVELAWRTPVDWFGGAESLALRLLGNLAFESSTLSDATIARVDRVGQTGVAGGVPRWQANLSLAYRRDALQLAVHERFTGRGRYNATYGPADIDDNTVAGVATTDLRAEWQLGSPRWSVFAHVANLFDRAPPDAPDWGFGGSIATNESLFDPLGRRYTIGVRLEL